MNLGFSKAFSKAFATASVVPFFELLYTFSSPLLPFFLASFLRLLVLARELVLIGVPNEKEIHPRRALYF
ncbi:hypothetical protein BP00DRAFT_227731 [Aspergillus indologenus CBS 114.80]|uniref:Uncharacterized protein n=1 Tax=Aspergillus indologenus CBS 114.80 TaxID=1450541 RepID=A0A2V5HYS3_9EURO|nr:hypothetical protein BP00DRAFT_227731 [Aspergillus indologenus CBS 114.80]